MCTGIGLTFPSQQRVCEKEEVTLYFYTFICLKKKKKQKEMVALWSSFVDRGVVRRKNRGLLGFWECSSFLCFLFCLFVWHFVLFCFVLGLAVPRAES